MLHTHRFGIGDPGAIAALIEKLELAPRLDASPRLERAIEAAEAKAIEIELGPRGQESERDLAFYHGLLTGYAVALRLSTDAASTAADARPDLPVVAALLPGSIEAATRAARDMGAPLEVVAAHAVTAPGRPRLELAAVTEGGFSVVDTGALAEAEVSPRTLSERLSRIAEALTHAVARLRANADPTPVRGRTVLVVTGRPAPGLTALAAERLFLERGAARVYVAAPAAGLEDEIVERRSEVARSTLVATGPGATEEDLA